MISVYQLKSNFQNLLRPITNFLANVMTGLWAKVTEPSGCLC